jgi:hypothetical protein
MMARIVRFFAGLGLLSAALIAGLASANTVLQDLNNFFKNPSQQLQKSQIIKIGPRPFNHDLTDGNRPKPNDFWIGVVGDSSTTGAAASPHFQASWSNIARHLADAVANLRSDDLGPDEPLPAPLRVMYTMSDFDQAVRDGNAQELNIQSLLSQKLDTEEYSFGYALANKLRVKADNVVLVGQDGTRVSSIFSQFQRLMTVGTGSLPPLIVMSYVANDLCGAENFTNGIDAFSRTFTAELRRQFAAVATLPANPRGTRLVVLAPLDVANVLTNTDLLTQKIPFEGNGEITCQQLRSGTIGGGGDFAKVMHQLLNGECGAILGPTPDPEGRIAILRALQDAQAAAFQQVIAEFNMRGLAIHAEYASSMKLAQFRAGDLANDCFHPSRFGADTMANQLLSHELSNVSK